MLHPRTAQRRHQSLPRWDRSRRGCQSMGSAELHPYLGLGQIPDCGQSLHRVPGHCCLPMRAQVARRTPGKSAPPPDDPKNQVPERGSRCNHTCTESPWPCLPLSSGSAFALPSCWRSIVKATEFIPSRPKTTPRHTIIGGMAAARPVFSLPLLQRTAKSA